MTLKSINKTAILSVLKKQWFSILLILLPIASLVSTQLALLTALVFTYLIPGLTACRFFKLKNYETAAFIPIFSVLVSTQLIYYFSLVCGYSSTTIIISFLALAVVHALVQAKKAVSYSFKRILKASPFTKKTVAIFLIILVISLTVLFRSVWFENQNGIVITGSNWQDTPLHYEIIQSLNNGNFPPEMPYYAGVEMNYHYFVDLHTAILEKVYGFIPILLPFTNAIFILIFALSMYSLTRERGETAANFATLIATFGWGFSFLILFSALASGQFSAAHNYTYDYNGFFGLPPIFDNLLQQRPLLIGLPAFSFVLTLLKSIDDKNRMLLAGIIAGLMFPFHMVSFLCAYIAYFFSILLNRRNFKKHSLLFLFSALIAFPFIISGSTSLSITIAPLWAFMFVKDNPVLFYVANLGIPFLLSIAFVTKVKGAFLKAVFVTLFIIPNLVSATPNPWDMYKFFIFAWIPIAVLSGSALAKIKKSFAVVLLLFSVLASSSVVLYNIGTNFVAASWSEYDAGMWIQNNTEEQAVFLTYYSIHCPPTMIGGRLRVSSYANWAYGHGVTLDKIYERFEDVDRAYSGTESELKLIVEKYNVSYIYVGKEELGHYPKCGEKFNDISWLNAVYTKDFQIFHVDL